MARTAALGIGLQPRAREALEQATAGCDLIEASHEEEALERLRERSFDLVILDAHAPGFSATTFDRVRAAAQDVPHAVLAPSEALDDLARLAEGHAFHFVPLELPPGRMAEMIGRLVRPRAAVRFALAAAGVLVEGAINGRRFEHPVLDLSSRGLSFAVPTNGSIEGLIPGQSVRDLRLHGLNGRRLLEQASATVRNCQVDLIDGRAVVRVGLSFDDGGGERTGAHLRTVTDPAQVLSALRKACRRHERFVVAVPDTDRSHETTHARLEHDTLVLELGEGAAPLGPDAVVRLSFGVAGQSYGALTALRSEEPGTVRLALPRALRVHHRRRSTRLLPPAGRPYLLRFCSPLTRQPIERRVLDIHTTGVSFGADLSSDVLPPGLVLDDVELVLPEGGEPLRLQGIVRGVRALVGRPDGEPFTHRCGVQFVDVPPQASSRLGPSLVSSTFPNLAIADETAFDEIWAFLREAGLTYHLYSDGSEQSLAAVKSCFESQVSRRGHEVTTSFVYRVDGRIRGHVSNLRLYSRAWLGTHLAAKTGEFRQDSQISRALVQASADHMESRPEVDFIKFFWKRALKWPNRVFGWTGRAIPQRELVEQREYMLLVRDNQTPLLPLPAGVSVREAQDDELAEIEQFLIERLGLFHVLSDDLSARSLRLGEVERAFAEAGLLRRRRVRVATVDGRLAGVGLVEQSAPGLQLNEFTSHGRLVPAAGLEPALAADVRRALATDAAALYSAEGRRHSVLLEEDPDLSPLAEAGYAPDGLFRALTLHRTVFRRFTDNIDLLFQGRGFQDASDS